MDNTNLSKPNQNMEMGWDDTIQEDKTITFKFKNGKEVTI